MTAPETRTHNSYLLKLDAKMTSPDGAKNTSAHYENVEKLRKLREMLHLSIIKRVGGASYEHTALRVELVRQ